VPIRDDITVSHPPDEGDFGKILPVRCEQCGLEADVAVLRNLEASRLTAVCPDCDGNMVWNISGCRFIGRSQGTGVSSTKYGMRRARELTARNEKLAKTQWDNHQPLSAVEGAIPRNPTPGGPYDPNGPFASKKVKPNLILPKGTSS
jgi:hypothetical protein